MFSSMWYGGAVMLGAFMGVLCDNLYFRYDWVVCSCIKGFGI